MQTPNGADRPGGGPEIGATLGIEEEYHLVDPATFALCNRAELSERAFDGQAGVHLRPEMLTSQLEAATDICTDLDQARAAVVAMRREAATAAAAHGATILATSTHPSAALTEIELMDRERYRLLVERFGVVPRAFNLCGCHVHVSVPDLDTAVRVMSRARPYLPLLSALSGSSPFHEGVDTGYESFRVAWLSLWQQGGPPPHLRSAEDYHDTVRQLVEIGIVDDSSQLLWDLRPSARYPTLEFRIADVCTDVDDVVLLAALTRSLVRTLARCEQAGIAAPVMSDTVLRAARWRAARYGLTESLASPVSGGLLPAAAVIEEVLAELRPDLVDHDEWALVTDLLKRLLARGTSAHRQRARFAANRSMHEVLVDAVQTTAAD